MSFHLPLALLGCLLAAARPGEPLKPLDVYGSDEAAFFRRHRVREIVVLEQGYYQGQLSGPRRALLVQQLDRQGRVVKEWKHPNGGRFTTLDESTYDAAGNQTSLTSYENASPETDTSRLGTQWQPDTRVYFAARPGQSGYSEKWDFRTRAWVRAENLRRWVSHDTTYVRSLREPNGACGTLLRTYPAPGGRTRTDYLMTGKCFLNDMVLVQPGYQYERRENGRLLESGLLNFDDALRDYLRQHPTMPVPSEGTHAYSDLLDYVAHHAEGRIEASATRTYDAQGRLLTEISRYRRTTYQRNAQGQATATELYAQPLPTITPVLAERTLLTYQPDGLVAREEVLEQGEKELARAAIRYYQYQYY